MGVAGAGGHGQLGVLGAHLLGERLGERALAGARLAGDKHHLAVAGDGPAEMLVQLGLLALAADED